MLAAAGQGTVAQADGAPVDWPEWAPGLSDHYRAVDALADRARDIREFGAVLDGVTDDTAAIQRAILSGADALLIPTGKGLRMTGSVEIRSAVAILGRERPAPIIWEGRERQAFLVQPDADQLDDFVENVLFDRISIIRADGLAPSGHLVSARNFRNLRVTRCRTERISLCYMGHLRQLGDRYDRRRGSAEVDPAVLAGFAPDHDRDLNDHALIADNRVDYGEYSGDVARINFCKHVVVFRNRGTFARISWWGGGARWAEGGNLRFLRRVRHCFIAENIVTGSNGGVYGNNGQYIIVARNVVQDMTDAGVDFEGCFDCAAYGNRVINIGNFGLATFYAARNIVFHDNYVEQNGDAATLHLRFGGGRIGNPKGIFVMGLRSSSFGRGDDGVSVTFRQNRFVWSGAAGQGRCLASFFSSLVFEENRFDNVTCDIRYRLTEHLTVSRNRFVFTLGSEEPVNIIGGSAERVDVLDNVIECRARMPDDSTAIFRTIPMRENSQTRITGNRHAGAAGALPILVTGKPVEASALRIAGNGDLPVRVENTILRKS